MIDFKSKELLEERADLLPRNAQRFASRDSAHFFPSLALARKNRVYSSLGQNENVERV